MKRVLLLACTLLLIGTALAQTDRLIKGFVQTEEGAPLKGATIESIHGDVRAVSGEDGAFELRVSPYVTQLNVTLETYLPAKVDIESAYLVIRLKVDKKYFANKAKAEAELAALAQQEAEAKIKAEEQKRLAAQKEAEAKIKAEEQKRLAAQKEAEAKAKAAAKAEEQKRLAAQKEAEAKVKLEEQKRLAAQKEAEAKVKLEEQKRLAAQKVEEQKRLADLKVTAAKEKAEEQKRLAAQKEAAKATREQLAKDTAEKRRKEYAEKQSGFGSIVDISYLTRGKQYPYPALGLSYTAGYRFNNQIYLGVGVGANLNMHGGQAIRTIHKNYDSKFLNPCLVSVPVFAYFKANFIDRRWSPYFAVAAGGNLSPKQTITLDLCDAKYNTMGVFINPQIGLNIRTTTKTSLYFAVGFQGFTAPSCIEYTGYNAVIRSALGYGLDVHFGFTF